MAVAASRFLQEPAKRVLEVGGREVSWFAEMVVQLFKTQERLIRLFDLMRLHVINHPTFRYMVWVCHNNSYYIGTTRDSQF